MKNSALQKLVDRNLKSVSKKQKKTRKNRKTKKVLEKKETPVAVLVDAEALDEIRKLKYEISLELDAAEPVYTKRARREQPMYDFEGLTPGLAPIGYDPDESDAEPF